MSVTAQFAQACSALAKQHGISTLVIVLREPGTGEPKIVATAGALTDPAIRGAVAGQFKLGGSSATASPPASAECEAERARLEARCAQLENEMASLGGDTGWG